MGIFEKNLIMMVVKYVLRWLKSNDENRKAKERLKKKEQDKK
jgi:hypothetical protein